MPESSQNAGHPLLAQYDKARRADVPDLAEVRRCRDLLMESVVDRALELMEAHETEESSQPQPRARLQLMSSDSPILSPPRGFCSPVKTADIRRFEELARRVFGDVESCATIWKE